jgi:ARG and Rhodanese-Phosphatase-superfamily-associated Protein domain
MRRRAFVHLVASFLASLPFAASAFAADGIQVSGPIVHDNLAIYLVHGAPAGGVVPLTLQEALAKGAVKVRETGSVNALTVENTGTDEVYIQAGDIVKGGQQDRVLSVDLLLPPRSGAVSIAAFCVEPGRWAARGNEDVKLFSNAGSAMPSHEVKMAMRAHAVAATPLADAPGGPTAPLATAPMAYVGGAGTAQSQQEIWSTVSKTQAKLSRSVGAPVAAAASPSSLLLSLENEKLKQAQAAYIAALKGPGEADADIVGYVFAINGKINSGDVYASNALFRKMWSKLLAANVTEAIGAKDTAGAAPPSVKEVEAFLATAATGVTAERAINASVRLATLDGDTALYAETRRTDGSWVHRNYLAK